MAPMDYRDINGNNWYEPTGSAITSSTTTTWRQWSEGYETTTTRVTCTTDSTTSVWVSWCDYYTQRVSYRGAPAATAEQVEMVRSLRERQRVNYERQQAEYAAERERLAAERKLADEKADQLLRDVLTPEQLEEFAALQYFTITSQSGKRYRIRLGRAGNIEELDEAGNPSHKICCHPADNVPDKDTIVVQKLLLEHDEVEFLRQANRRAVA